MAMYNLPDVQLSLSRRNLLTLDLNFEFIFFK